MMAWQALSLLHHASSRNISTCTLHTLLARHAVSSVSSASVWSKNAIRDYNTDNILTPYMARTNQLRSNPISVRTNPMRFHVANIEFESINAIHHQFGVSGTGLMGLSLARSHSVGSGPKDVAEATILHTSRTRFRPAA
jgi:hypothetical protein